MKISLKANAENNNIEKIKVYPLRTLDREIVNRIFDELHEKKRFE